MKPFRGLRLAKETLAELTADDMRRAVAGDALTHAEAASACGHPCLTDDKVCVSLPVNGCLSVKVCTAG